MHSFLQIFWSNVTCICKHSMHVIFPQPQIFDLIILIIFDVNNKLWTSKFCNFLQPSLASYLPDQNMCLASCSHTPSTANEHYFMFLLFEQQYNTNLAFLERVRHSDAVCILHTGSQIMDSGSEEHPFFWHRVERNEKHLKGKGSKKSFVTLLVHQAHWRNRK